MLDFLPLPLSDADLADTEPWPARSWDIFCQVIDNFGDAGVCWRTAAELAARGQRVRLWMDDASALQWMAPLPHPTGLTVHGWPQHAGDVPPQVGDVVLEAFGCEIPAPFQAAMARQAGAGRAPVWINLEYLSAEGYVERCHRLPSRIMSGPAAGMTRWFFYPGFTALTGGLLREQALAARQQAFAQGEAASDTATGRPGPIQTTAARQSWRQRHGITAQDCAISLFCYEPAALPQWLQSWRQRPAAATGESQAHLLITPGRAAAAVQAALQTMPHAAGGENAPDRDAAGTSAAPGENRAEPLGALRLHWLAACSQPEFDEMLWASDLNLVRGEDSLVRALWAGQPLVWHIYPQHDNAHHDKLQAFLTWLKAPPSLWDFHLAWNGISAPGASAPLPALTPQLLRQWQDCVRLARRELLARGPQSELISQIQAFAAEKS